MLKLFPGTNLLGRKRDAPKKRQARSEHSCPDSLWFTLKVNLMVTPTSPFPLSRSDHWLAPPTLGAQHSSVFQRLSNKRYLQCQTVIHSWELQEPRRWQGLVDQRQRDATRICLWTGIIFWVFLYIQWYFKRNHEELGKMKEKNSTRIRQLAFKCMEKTLVWVREGREWGGGWWFPGPRLAQGALGT